MGEWCDCGECVGRRLNPSNYQAQEMVAAAVADRKEALEENERLRAALADALEGLEEMLPYVEDYFVEKWDHKGYVARAREALEGPK